MNNYQPKISHSNEIRSQVLDALIECKDDLIIISAFVKLDTIKWIDQNVKNLVNKKLVVRFQKSDVIFGATDYEVIPYCLENGWKVKFDLKLHSKIYIFDQQKFIIGSANATQRGLSLAANSNIETVVSGYLDKSDFGKIFHIYESATSFTNELLLTMKEELKESIDNKVGEENWTNEAILNLKKPQKLILLKEDLLTSSDIINMTEHDKILLGLGLKSSLKEFEIVESFVDSKIYLWLIMKLKDFNSVLYFGKLSQLLHEDIALNESIYRKDIKIYTANLINWIIQLEIKEIRIDRPNHSQRISLIV